MSEVHFEATIGDDRVIRLPSGVALPAGAVEVTIRSAQKPRSPSAGALAATREWLVKTAIEAEENGPDLPADLAKNHDHYAHGKPRE